MVGCCRTRERAGPRPSAPNGRACRYLLTSCQSLAAVMIQAPPLENPTKYFPYKNSTGRTITGSLYPGRLPLVFSLCCEPDILGDYSAINYYRFTSTEPIVRLLFQNEGRGQFSPCAPVAFFWCYDIILRLRNALAMRHDQLRGFLHALRPATPCA
jgi:hypothetical protein